MPYDPESAPNWAPLDDYPIHWEDFEAVQVCHVPMKHLLVPVQITDHHHRRPNFEGVPTTCWTRWHGLGVTASMMESHTRTERGENMSTIHGKVHIVGQQSLTGC